MEDKTVMDFGDDDDKIPDASSLFYIHRHNDKPLQETVVTYSTGNGCNVTYITDKDGMWTGTIAFNSNGTGGTWVDAANGWTLGPPTVAAPVTERIAEIPERPYAIALLRGAGGLVLRISVGGEEILSMHGEAQIRAFMGHMDFIAEALENTK